MTTAGKNTFSNFYQQNHTLVAFCPNSILLKALQFELMDNFDNCFIAYPDGDIVSEIKSHLNKKVTGKSNEYFIDLEPQSLDCEKISNYEKFCQLLLNLDNLVQENHLKMIVVLPFFDPYFAATLADSWIKHYSPKQAEHFSMLGISGTNPAEITITNGEHADETMTFEFYHELPYSDFFKNIITNKLQNEILANQHNREVFDHLIWEIRNNRPNSEISQKEIEQKLESLNASFDDLRDYIVEDNCLFKTLKNKEAKILRKELLSLKLKNDSTELQVLIEKAKILVGDKAVSCEELFVDCQNGFERYIIARAAMQKWKLDKKRTTEKNWTKQHLYAIMKNTVGV